MPSEASDTNGATVLKVYIPNMPINLTEKALFSTVGIVGSMHSLREATVTLGPGVRFVCPGNSGDYVTEASADEIAGIRIGPTTSAAAQVVGAAISGATLAAIVSSLVFFDGNKAVSSDKLLGRVGLFVPIFLGLATLFSWALWLFRKSRNPQEDLTDVAIDLQNGRYLRFFGLSSAVSAIADFANERNIAVDRSTAGQS